MRPVVGITPDLGETTARPGRPVLPRYELKQAYANAVEQAGGLPVVLPYLQAAGSSADDAILEVLQLCDALVITGGAFDIPPELYGATPAERLGPLKPGRTAFEQRLLRAALVADVPVLGICGGMQLLAVELGGTLHQDILHELPGALDHEQKTDPREPAHPAAVVPGSELQRIVRTPTLDVNSTHHQAVKSPGRATISATAPDGVIEAIELAGKFAVGVEWHPELLAGEEHLALYRALVERARR